MANTQFTTQIEHMCQRVRRLYQSAGPTQQHSAVLTSAFVEFEVALDMLRAIENELRQARAALEDRTATIDSEHQRYQELFALAPDGYLATSLDGMIRRANRAAAILLQSREKDLIRQSLTGFIPAGERHAFQTRLTTLRTMNQVQRWELQLQPCSGTAIAIDATIAVARTSAGQPTGLYWLLRDNTICMNVEQEREARGAEPEQLQQRYIGQVASAELTP
jgi:two-component system cell cycle sensor histidine kinase/response regulator CckA